MVSRRCIAFLLAACLMVLCQGVAVRADETGVKPLIEAVHPYLQIVAGQAERFKLTAEVSVPIDGRPQQIDASLIRYDNETFDLVLAHADYAITVRRRERLTVVELPKHHTAFVGRGDVTTPDSLRPLETLSRMISPHSELQAGLFLSNLLKNGDATAVATTILQGANLQFDESSGSWKSGSDGALNVLEDSGLQIQVKNVVCRLSIATGDAVGQAPEVTFSDDVNVTELNRDELELTFCRGLRRATEILKPGQSLTSPKQTNRNVAHGTLQWIDGQRVATLWGTPEEIGTAHGQLLSAEATRCIESVLYSFGTAHVIRTGRWFRHDLDAAYARLSPHIPERHKQETQALAAALNLDPDVVQSLNVFPELFHCSGFAVFGSATRDGKLYHGRVLDYMTTVGLQDAATTFIVRAENQIPFANVGYGGFIGSVSGMNAEAISLGEMGGRGEGQWDGAPMATLMRRALEECRTLDQVKSLWTNSPRTCEYYYVFADGKTNQAVGVAATPDKIELIGPGETDERLGTGITDAVVLSAGSRLQELRRRVTERHGQIDADVGMWLMSRPVAMQSNLHNVLFVPQDQVLYVANASHTKPAAEMPYVKLNLQTLLQQIPDQNTPKRVAGN